MEATLIVAVVGVILSILTYFAGIKKQSNSDVEKRAYFEGEITAKIDQLIKRFDSLEQKLTKDTSSLYDEIAKKINEHEKRYHNG